MKIAYFVNEYPKVSHSFIRREILALERKGFSIHRIALRGWSGPLPDPQDRLERARTQYVLRDGVAALCLPVFSALLRAPVRFFKALGLAIQMSFESDRSLPYHLVYLAEACRVRAWLDSSGVQSIHAHFGTNSTEVVMLVHELGGPPYSFTVHGPDEFLRPLGLREKIARSRFVVAISNFGRSQLFLRSLYENWAKIQVVHCGLEKAFYQGSPTFGVTVPRLVCVGRLCEAKGQVLLVEAVSRLVAQRRDLELVLAGDGPLRQQLHSMIENNGLGSHVRITGWLSGDEVRDEILAAQVLVLPSFSEGLPVVLMEAMALRRPVISTYVAGIPELVVPGENGWLVPAGSVEELTRAIEECLDSSPESRRNMGEAGHRRVLLRHSVDVEVAKLATLFESAET